MKLADNINFGNAVLGGVIIGFSATMFLLLTGKLTGISGILEDSILPVPGKTKKWTFAYLGGMICAGIVAYHADKGLGDQSHAAVDTLIAGILVGFGTRMGSGCTSGHGICGLSRLSPRSAVAVCSFMGSGLVSSYVGRVYRNKDEFPSLNPDLSLSSPYAVWIPVSLAMVGFYVLFYFLNHTVFAPCIPPATPKVAYQVMFLELASSFLCAFVFGIGLAISGMCNPQRVIKFLDFSGPDGWDPSLAGVMAGGVLVNVVSFYILRKMKVAPALHQVKQRFSPPNSESSVTTMDTLLKYYLHPANMVIDAKLVIGSLVFGLGWGFAGICPGPAFVNIGALSDLSGVFIPGLLIGMALHEGYKMFTSDAYVPASNCACTSPGDVEENEISGRERSSERRPTIENALLESGNDGEPSR